MVKKRDKTPKQLIEELTQLRRRIAELEAAGHKRNRLEEALRTERDKAQHYLDIAEVILIALNKKGEITLINRKGNQILGYKERELLGKDWFTTCVPAPRRKKLKSRFLELMAGKIKLTEFYEDPALTKAGTERIIVWHNSLLKDAQGNTIGTMSSGEDITGLKQAEETLRQKTEESELQYRTTLNSMGDAIHVIDKNLRFVIFNDAFKRWNEELGLETNVIGRTVTEVFPFLPKKIGDEYRQVFKTGKPLITEENTKINGGEYITETRKIPIFEGSNVARIVTIIRDITERKQIEAELKASETKFRELFECMSSAVAVYEARESGGDFIFKDFNRAGEQIEQVKRQNIISKSVLEMFPGVKDFGLFEVFQRVWRSGKPEHFPASIYRDERIVGWRENYVYKLLSGEVVAVYDDITERKRAEEELRESEATLRALINAPTDSILLLDSQGVILDLNEIAAERLAKSRDELIGTLADSSLPKDVAKKRRSLISQILETGREVRFEDKRDGIWFDTVAHPITDKDGVITKIAIIARDITERKQAEETLHKSEDKYRTILENIEEGYYEVDLAGNFTFFNDTMCRIWGYPKEELMGMNNRQYTDEKHAKKVFQAFNEVYRTGKPAKVYDYEIIKKDGTRAYVEASISLQKDSSGKAIGFKGIIRDITDQKRLEEILEKERQELKLIFDSIPITVFYKDKEGRFIRVNKTFAKALKIPAGDFVGKTVFDLYSPEIAQGMTDDDQEVFQSRRPKLNIIAQYESARGVRWARTDKVPIFDKHGMSIGLIGFAQDITERKQAEEEIISLARFPSENPNPVLRIERDGTIKYANKASQLLLQEWGASVGSPAPPFWQEIVTQALCSQSKNIVEVACKEQVYSFVIAPIPDAGYVNLYGRDITERKRAEEALQESEEKYRDLVENINDILYATDESGTVTYIAPTIEFLSRYTPSEIIGHPFFEFIYQDDLPLAREDFQEVVSGRVKAHEYRMVNKSGVVRWVRTSSRPLFKESRFVGLRGIMTDITDRKRAEEEVKRSYEQLQETLHSTVSALASTVEMKDQYTAGHQPRVTKLACAIAEEMGLSEDQIEGIHMAASIHDIGKIMVPAEILNKPGPLTEIQYEMIKMHPRAGYDILKGLKLPWPVAKIILQHHERMDGSGYPQGLSGKEIMVEAKILSVANVVEAMNAHRPYRPAYDIKEALAEISKNRGTWYDPSVVDACLRLFTKKRFILDSLPR